MKKYRARERVGKVVLTYGTFDLLHRGHIRLLQRARKHGDYLIVALSTDEFNRVKGKECVLPFKERRLILENLRLVDRVIPERSWEQKRSDIKRLKVDVFVMGDDWRGKFDELKDCCRVVYLPRTKGISTTMLKERMGKVDQERRRAEADKAALVQAAGR
jgi:glycerol-3-phosphate cytidylyltransferase